MFDRVKILQVAGNGIRAIVRETGFNWRTVAKWAGLGELPERNVMAAKPTTPGNFQNHLSQRWAEGCRLGGIRMLSIIYVIAACALVLASFGLPHAGAAVAVFVVGMSALGMGNGSVFQLVPQRFGKEIGMMTGIVGMTGGLGGFYLASSLGYSKQFTGSFQSGFLLFAGLAFLALVGLTAIKRHWRTTWGAASVSVARI
jgi:hypothetical protein